MQIRWLTFGESANPRKWGGNMNAKVMKEVIPSTSLNLVAEKHSFSTPSTEVFTYKEIPLYIVVKYWSTGYNVNETPVIYSAPHQWELVQSTTFFSPTSGTRLLNAGIGDIYVTVNWNYQNDPKKIRAGISPTAYRYAYAEVYGIYFS